MTDLRAPTGADCVWFQEAMAESKTVPDPVVMLSRFTDLDAEGIEAMPSAEVWPLYHAALDAIMEGYPKPGEA